MGGTSPTGGYTALAVAVILVAGCGSDTSDSARAAGGESTGGGQTVELSEWTITPAVIDAPPGAELVLAVTNTGEIEHDITFESGVGTERIKPGDTVTVDLGVIAGEIPAWCSIPGHRENGMEAMVRVADE